MGMTDSDSSGSIPATRARLAADLAAIAAEEHWQPIPTESGAPDLTDWLLSQRSIEHPVGGQRGTRRRKWKGGIRV